MQEILKVVSNNPLASTVVGTIIATAVLASVRPTRTALGRLIRWTLGIAGKGVRRLRNRVGEALMVKPPTPTDSGISGISIMEHQEMSAELGAWKREALDARNYMKFGEPLPEFTPLLEVRHEDVVTRVSELGPTTGLMMRYCEEVWHALRPRYPDIKMATRTAPLGI